MKSEMRITAHLSVDDKKFDERTVEKIVALCGGRFGRYHTMRGHTKGQGSYYWQSEKVDLLADPDQLILAEVLKNAIQCNDKFKSASLCYLQVSVTVWKADELFAGLYFRPHVVMLLSELSAGLDVAIAYKCFER